MYCPNCGTKNKSKAKYCKNCGYRLKIREETESEKRPWLRVLTFSGAIILVLIVGVFLYPCLKQRMHFAQGGTTEATKPVTTNPTQEKSTQEGMGPSAPSVVPKLTSTKPSTSTPKVDSSIRADIWVLDNADPDYETPPFDDKLIAMDNEGNVIFQVEGLNTCQTNGSVRAIAASPDGMYALVAEHVADRLLRFSASGNDWILDRSTNAVDISANGYAYTLTSSETIYGDSLLLVDPDQGLILQESDVGGIDLVVDDVHDAVWVVGVDIKKLNRDLELMFTIDPIGHMAVSVDFASDGSVLVAERDHSEVSESQSRLLRVSPIGDIVWAVELDFDPLGLSVDRTDNSVWVVGDKLYKFDHDGSLILEVDSGRGFSVKVDQEDGSVWVAGYTGTVRHYTQSGQKLLILPGFSDDQTYIAISQDDIP